MIRYFNKPRNIFNSSNSNPPSKRLVQYISIKNDRNAMKGDYHFPFSFIKRFDQNKSIYTTLSKKYRKLVNKKNCMYN